MRVLGRMLARLRRLGSGADLLLTAISVRAALLGSLAAFAALVIVSWGSLWWALNTQSGDAALVNLAGRQRMLSQRLVKEVALAVQAEDPVGYLNRADATAAQFEEGFRILREGGVVTLGDTRLTVPSLAGDPMARAALETLEADWALVRQELARIRPSGPGSPAMATSLRVLDQRVDAILSDTDALTAYLEARARSRVTRARWLAAGGGTLLLALLGLVYVGMTGAVIGPLRILQDTVRRMSAGDLDSPVPLRARNELGELSEALEETRVRRRDAERELEAVATRLGAVLSTAPNAIITADEGQRIISFNRAAEEMFGYSAEEVRGQPLDMLMPSRFAEAHRAHMWAFGEAPEQMRRMGEMSAGIVGRRKDGREFPVEASIAKADLPDGRVYIAILADITERRRWEELLRLYTRDLERSNQELERFAYIASHDLREPLRMVSAYVTLIAQRYGGQLDQDAQEFIGYAVDGARRMGEMIDSLLVYSRVGTQGASFQPTDVAGVVRDALDNLKLAIQESGAEVTVDPLPTVLADRTQLLHVFQNLVENAIKFRGEEPPRVHISAQRADGEWRFTVRDNGIGIAPQDHDRIFRLFQRLDRKGRYPGTGAGLSVARRIVERHGGQIWVESQPGQGSTFYFTIPVPGEGT